MVDIAAEHWRNVDWGLRSGQSCSRYQGGLEETNGPWQVSDGIGLSIVRRYKRFRQGVVSVKAGYSR